MISSRIPVQFRRLRWKLTFSYTLVTVAAFLTLGVAAVLLAVLMNQSSRWLDYYQSLAIELAADARPFLEAAPSDSASLEVAISSEDWTVVVSPARELLAANPQVADDEISTEPPFVDPYAPEESRRLISQALAGAPGIVGRPDGTILTVAPILGSKKEVLGVLYLRGFSDTLIPGSILRSGLLILGVSAIVITLAAGLIGALFGRITSRGLVRRLENLNSAAQAWGQGDFSASVHDSSADEIGQLSRRMSQMAEQIQDLLQVRQDLAALQERNRLARDLHDSVKQQVFAATMTLGTAKSRREQDPETAWDKVDEALDLSWQAQQELTGLIQELRPLALEGRGLAAALRDYAASWSQQSGIRCDRASRCWSRDRA